MPDPLQVRAIRAVLRALAGAKHPHPYEHHAPASRPRRTGEPPARITYLDHKRRRDVLVMAGANTPAPTPRRTL